MQNEYVFKVCGVQVPSIRHVLVSERSLVELNIQKKN